MTVPLMLQRSFQFGNVCTLFMQLPLERQINIKSSKLFMTLETLIICSKYWIIKSYGLHSLCHLLPLLLHFDKKLL